MSENKAGKKKLKPFAWVLIAVILCLAGGLIWASLGNHSTSGSKSAAQPSSDASPITIAALQAQNPEVQAQLSFGNGLISQNVVQAADNVKYLSTSWDLKEDDNGAVFMDYRNKPDDQNLILYGHYVSGNAKLMFGPLTLLTSKDNYQINKNFSLKFGSETRKYVITDVYYYTMNDDSLKYYLTSYDSEYFSTYMDAVKKCEFYDTGEALKADDHWITLQTCVENRGNQRLIVLARETGREK